MKMLQVEGSTHEQIKLQALKAKMSIRAYVQFIADKAIEAKVKRFPIYFPFNSSIGLGVSLDKDTLSDFTLEEVLERTDCKDLNFGTISEPIGDDEITLETVDYIDINNIRYYLKAKDTK